MRELRQDWRDIFGGFRVAFDVWKLLLGFLGVVVTFLVLWGLRSIPEQMADGTPLAGWVIAMIVAAILWVGLLVKFATSDTGFTVSKVVMLLVVGVVLAGAVLLCRFTETAGALGYIGGQAFAVLVIWAFFGGAITRIAVVEIATDDRIGLGEATGFAWKKYGAYLGATLLPVLAIIFLALCCALFGLVLRVMFVDLLVTLLFFVLVVLAGFLMFLIGLGGLAGAPLMYPAVSAEGNDSFDAISRAYSYVFGRPWRYIFYNFAAGVYGLACAFFVGFFVKYMLGWSLACVNYGSNGYFEEKILPRLQTFLSPLRDYAAARVQEVAQWLADWDVTGYVASAFALAQKRLGLGLEEPLPVDDLALAWPTATASVLMAIGIYVVVGLVLAYIVSLFFSMETTIYLLLRKGVDGAEMTEVYREEEEEDYLSVTPEAPAQGAPPGPKEETKEEEKPQ